MAGDLFAGLLARPGFRADLLYFVQLAGNYAASIFANVRNRAPFSHRRAFDDWLAVRDMCDTALRNALTRHDAWFDAHKADFAVIIEEMPQYMRDRLARALAEDHVIPLDLRNFIRALDDLRNYRHGLEHPERQRKVSDVRLLEVLGLMLLPFLSAHLTGRIRHHGSRANLPRREVHAMAEQAKAILDAAIARRREASRFMNGLKRRTGNDEIAAELERKRGNSPSDWEVHNIARDRKKVRLDLESRKAALIVLHHRYFDEHTWPRYNLENFLIRFGFIGRARIAQLERLLGVEGDARPDFINAIEPAFMVSIDMALIVHGWLTELEEHGLPLRDEKKFKRKGRLLADENEHDRGRHYKRIVAIRNAVAHGGWLWQVADPDKPDRNLPMADVLAALLALPLRFAFNDHAQWRNDLLTRIEGALRPCGWTHVYALAQPGDDPNTMPARHVVKHWTAEKRVRFADKALWRKDKRPALRRIAAAWMRDIARARKNASGKN